MFSTIILAAGLGKRMQKPDEPKALSKLHNKPLIYYVINAALNIASEKIVLVVGHKKERLIDYVNGYCKNLNEKMPNICFATQAEQLGTAHAVLCAANDLQDYNGNVLILSGDVPLLRPETLKSFIKKHNESVVDISVLTATADNPFGYGRIKRNKCGDFISIVEEKEASAEEKLIKEINSGIYFLSSSLLFNILKKVTNNNNQHEYYLTDIISISISNNYRVAAENIANFKEIQGINTPEQLLEAEKTLFYYKNAI